ncbi:MAG TPA: alpha-L-fucosidase [Jatrophihabitantaceae bacterium]
MTTSRTRLTSSRNRRRLAMGTALAALISVTTGLTGITTPRARAAAPTTPVPVPLTSYQNNNGIGDAAGDADVDGSGYGFPAAALPSGSVNVGGVPYEFPTTTGTGQNDNVVALGQTITLPSGHYLSGYLLAASTYGSTGGGATVHYTNGTTSSGTASAPDWYTGNGAIVAPYRYSPTGTDQHPVSIYSAQLWIDPNREATSITLPTTSAPVAGTSSLHVFALSLQPVAPGYAVAVRDAKSTTKQITVSRTHAQVVSATVMNLGDQWIDRSHSLTVSVVADGVRTVQPATITELAPGDEARVEIGITSAGLPAGLPLDGTVRVKGQGVAASQAVYLSVGIPAYLATDASLSQHQSPDWFNNGKFGIFIHWGIYSVPAWAPVGQEYAEWYWQHLDNPNDPTYAYHAQKYGKDFNYDQFIPQFTAAKFDPKAWVQLFDQAGADYFVLTSKHHGGFSLFDTAYSDRNSVKMGPHQDLVGELFAADRKYTPDIHPGLYYSLPEWYNPALPWQGHGPQNPYTGAPVPYTGYKPVADYVNDFQVPQMKELITKYQPDVLWCDIGYPATDRSVLQTLFNQELVTGHPSTVDDRCGLPDSDFNTPEYASSFSLQTTKFEASRGIDPFSYGYNSATPDDQYATADQLVDQLADIVSKNGNFLLDIGPRADGTIPQIMQTRLREMGAWLKVNGESIYNTTYWARGATDGDLRFTVAPNKAFYVTSLTQPGDTVTVHSPVPIRPGDTISLLGYHGPALHWAKASDGSLAINVPAAARNSGQYAWVFKINWKH